jgi:dGTPase
VDRFGASAFDDRERLVAEGQPTFRTEGQRDRDRILYSSAFLRLGHVTQVTAPETGRVFHTRLTHSLKVAQVARRTAESLPKQVERGQLKDERFSRIDPDVVEAAALAHDLGHPPFGHIAEEELHHAAAKAGGFEGNAQSFRIVARLALRDWTPDDARAPYEGLNLTWQVLNGILKYPHVGAAMYESDQVAPPPKIGAYYSEGELLQAVRTQAGYTTDAKCLAAQIMDWADDLTYAVHDVEDFFRAGILPIWRLAEPEERARFLEYQSALYAHRKGVAPEMRRWLQFNMVNVG